MASTTTSPPEPFPDLNAFLVETGRYLIGLCEAATPAEASAAALIRKQLSARLQAHSQHGKILPIHHVCGVFKLTATETDLLLLYLCHYYRDHLPEYQQKISSQPLHLGAAFRIVNRNPDHRDLSIAGLYRSPLLLWQLLQLEAAAETKPLPASQAYLDNRIAAFLMGDMALDQSLSSAVTPLRPLMQGQVDPYLETQTRQRLGEMVSQCNAAPQKAFTLLFQGASERQAAAAFVEIGRLLDTVMLTCDLEQVLDTERLKREVYLLGAGLCVTMAANPSAQSRAAYAALQGHVPLLLCQTTAAAQALPVCDAVFHFPQPDLKQSRAMLQILGVEIDDETLLRTPFAEIEAATVAFKKQWYMNAPNSKAGQGQCFRTFLRQQSATSLAKLASQVKHRVTWSDLILPAHVLQHLQEIPTHYAHRAEVLDTWGLASKVSDGRGIHVLFSGPSGTGKTLAASVIANAMQLDLYRIDLAAIISKYIGETEKNLDRIFQAAQQTEAVLFFDEADALFGKRGEVEKGNDRYANIEVGYLLQKMEGYSGVTILATNLADNLDEAFGRRMRFVVPFPFPDRELRRQIFKRLLPAAVPKAEDLDFERLAEQCEATGGTIKVVVLAACFMAAAEGQRLSMRHFQKAMTREWQKTGRPLDL